MNKTVWLYHKGCKHEGGSTISVHASRETAMVRAHNDAATDCQQWAGYLNSIGEDLSKCTVQEIEDGFEVGTDIYVVCEYEVKE